MWYLLWILEIGIDFVEYFSFMGNNMDWCFRWNVREGEGKGEGMWFVC